MTTQPTPEEVHTAANTVQALSVSMDMPHPDVHWRPSELRAEAERIEQAAREEAERADMVDVLAAGMYQLGTREAWPSAKPETQQQMRAIARALVDDGWRRES